MIKLRNHKTKKIKLNTEFEFSSIEELAEQIIETSVNLFEFTYSKDSMTNNQIPVIHLLKALINLHKDGENKNMSAAKYLETVLEPLLIDFEDIEEINAKY